MTDHAVRAQQSRVLHVLDGRHAVFAAQTCEFVGRLPCVHLNQQPVRVGHSAGLAQQFRVAGVDLTGGEHGAQAVVEAPVPASAEVDAIAKPRASVLAVGLVPDLSARCMAVVHGPEARCRIAAQSNVHGALSDTGRDGDVSVAAHLVVVAKLHDGCRPGTHQFGEGALRSQHLGFRVDRMAHCGQHLVQRAVVGLAGFTAEIAGLFKIALGEERVGGVQVRIDEPGNHEAPAGVDADAPLFAWPTVLGSNVLDGLTCKDDKSVPQHLLPPTPPGDDRAVFDEGLYAHLFGIPAAWGW